MDSTRVVRMVALVAGLAVAVAATPTGGSAPSASVSQSQMNAADVNARLDTLKAEVVTDIESRERFTQQMVDSIFSFGELGFQEFKTAEYCIELLRKNGFTIQENISGIPTQWIASWGSGKPVIGLGFDIDGVPKTSQKPGVGYHDPIIEGAPGHGEGHNAGAAVQITAALAVKQIMEREGLSGTLRVWPGVAEELVATKEFLVRDGVFKDVDAELFVHIGNSLGTSWGQGNGSGLVSVEYTFQGESAHSAGRPWRGRSAMDAVELMNVGVNFRREHWRISQRTHYVITNGGDQPNVVPSNASVWYYFRETDYPNIRKNWEAGNEIAEGAALMTGTTVTRRILGSAWPSHTNKALAETAYENVKQVGQPAWTDADLRLAKALQRELGVPEVGIPTEIGRLGTPVDPERRTGGPSNDLGHVAWNVPQITTRFPGNLPNLPGHNWANAITMATPIAHKGATAGAKVQAMTVLDLLLKPEILKDAWDYLNNVQLKEMKYEHFIGPDDKPAIERNTEILAEFREELKKNYFDPTRFDTYLEQLGIEYPTVR